MHGKTELFDRLSCVCIEHCCIVARSFEIVCPNRNRGKKRGIKRKRDSFDNFHVSLTIERFLANREHTKRKREYNKTILRIKMGEYFFAQLREIFSNEQIYAMIVRSGEQILGSPGDNSELDN